MLAILTRGGHTFYVVGESAEDVPRAIFHRTGWVSFEAIDGSAIQIAADTIVAVKEIRGEAIK